MKQKEVEIRVESLEDSMQDAAEAVDAIKHGKKFGARKVIAFQDLATLRSVLTDERIKLLRIIRKKQPKNLSILTKIAKRKYANVFNDVKVLEELELIELEKENQQVEPKANYKKLKIEIPV